MLSGYAWDPEDGPLPDESLTWESDRDGFLDAGDEVVVSTLSSGHHIITLSATDSEDQVGTATVNIFVRLPPIYLPIVLRGH
jgi:hypothetical protein